MKNHWPAFLMFGFGVLIYGCSSNTSDTLITADSPIGWRAHIFDAKSRRYLNGVEIYELLKNGISDKALGVKCTLRLESGFRKILEERQYQEIIFIEYDVKGVAIKLSGIGCKPYSANQVCQEGVRKVRNISSGKDLDLGLSCGAPIKNEGKGKTTSGK